MNSPLLALLALPLMVSEKEGKPDRARQTSAAFPAANSVGISISLCLLRYFAHASDYRQNRAKRERQIHAVS